MPEPISLTTLIIVGALGVLFGGSVVVVIAINWEAIVAAWSGKRLAIVGAETTGKTVLLRFLTGGIIPERYNPTRVAEQTNVKTFKLEQLKLVLKKTYDVPGVKLARDEWKSLVEDCDVLLYLVRADLLLSGDNDTAERLRNDAQLINTWLRQKEKACFIIGTFADKISGYRDLDGEGLVALGNKFSSNPTLIQAVSSLRTEHTKIVHVLIGSQEKVSDQQRLVMEILTALVKGSSK